MPAEDGQVEDTTVPVDLNDLPHNATLVPPSPTDSSFEPNMAGNSTSEVPSGPHLEKSEGDLPDWADTMLEKIERLTVESRNLRDMYRESQQEVILLRFKLCLVTEIDRMRDFEKALARVAPGYYTSEEFDSADLKMFAEYLLAKQHADDKKRADENNEKEA
ncbi:uncharacterized protein N7503_003376 [Penicillium pulvis]|uniref:uncharacterized protein n=1 Tax=Penicillium pulvis TaxID=1562058 RepID=UPI002547A731|nr:uncharacterized protein N7503_003376 [Penicillium pulvis]KAJ5805774.1 hypothetical protein N7503_003376 [Penicillium pulvis]